MALATVLLSASGLAFASTEHVVQEGETLSQIANRYGFPVQTLLDVNGIDDPNAIHAGQVIEIPGFASGDEPVATGRYHTVVAGDTLAGIAAFYGLPLQTLAEANAIANVNLVRVGQALLIPGGSPSPAPTQAPDAHGTTYTVKPGDTLFTIAGGFGVSMTAIVEANGLASENLIRVGEVLIIPGVPGE